MKNFKIEYRVFQLLFKEKEVPGYYGYTTERKAILKEPEWYGVCDSQEEADQLIVDKADEGEMYIVQKVYRKLYQWEL